MLLNDPTYVEAARVFGARILQTEGTVTQRIQWAWLRALQREPDAAEVTAMTALFTQQLADYQADPAAAEALSKVGAAPAPAGLDKASLAAWTHVARVLLNLHESITRS